jgi:hypothetical protein
MSKLFLFACLLAITIAGLSVASGAVQEEEEEELNGKQLDSVSGNLVYTPTRSSIN